MMRCKDCGMIGEDEEFAVKEDGAVVCDGCPKCASPHVGSFDPD